MPYTFKDFDTQPIGNWEKEWGRTFDDSDKYIPVIYNDIDSPYIDFQGNDFLYYVSSSWL